MPRHVEFAMSRADYAALTTALARRPLALRLLGIAFLWALLAGLLWAMPSALVFGETLLHDVLAGDGTWWPLFGVVAVFSLILAFAHRLAGLAAAASFARSPFADAVMKVDMDDAEVRVAAENFDWSFPWAAVLRVIESADHLILATGRSEGLPLPRRVAATPEDWEALRAFVSAHLPEGVSHERL